MGELQSQPEQLNRVLQQSAETRMRAIREKISLISTFCATADIEVKFGQMGRAQELLHRIHSAIDVLTAHINEPAHVSDKTIKQEFLSQLDQLRRRVSLLRSQVERGHSGEPPRVR